MISIDSNIVRRLIENNNEVISKINELRKSYLKIAINIDSFFEMLFFTERNDIYNDEI